MDDYRYVDDHTGLGSAVVSKTDFQQAVGRLASVLCFVVMTNILYAQAPAVDGDQLGAWYMYFFSSDFDTGVQDNTAKGVWGVQGDVQLRQWNIAGDLEQSLLRGGVRYSPASISGIYTLGYAHITTGQFGSDFDGTTQESRIYQEAFLPHRLSDQLQLTHRFRYEQRFVEGQDFRTRYRYNLFLNVPFNGIRLSKGVYYAALYNELFINGQREIGEGRSVQFFDRNRTYVGLGYGLSDRLRMQLGIMRQTTVSWAKNQLQFSLHHAW